MEKRKIYLSSLFLIISLCGVIVTRYIWNLYFPSHISSDCEGYWNLAINLASIGKYKQGGLPEIFWPPFFPYLLSVFISLKWNVFNPPLLLIGLQTINAFLIWKLARKISPNLWVSVLTIIIYIIYPSNLVMSNVYLTEHLFNPLLNLFFLIVFNMIIIERKSDPGKTDEKNTIDDKTIKINEL